jgi:hypothetical protein
MSIRKTALVTALGLSLASAPVVAQTTTQPTQPARAGATLDQANAQEWHPTTEAYGLGLYFAFIDDDEEGPVTPA